MSYLQCSVIEIWVEPIRSVMCKTRPFHARDNPCCTVTLSANANHTMIHYPVHCVIVVFTLTQVLVIRLAHARRKPQANIFKQNLTLNVTSTFKFFIWIFNAFVSTWVCFTIYRTWINESTVQHCIVIVVIICTNKWQPLILLTHLLLRTWSLWWTFCTISSRYHFGGTAARFAY